MSTTVYKGKIRNIDHLEDRMGDTLEALPQEYINKSVNSFRKRVRACIAAEGKLFEYVNKPGLHWYQDIGEYNEILTKNLKMI